MERENVVPTPPRTGAGWLRLCAVVGLVCGFAPAAMANYRIAGQIVYGTVSNNLGENIPPTSLFLANTPIKHVQVELVQLTILGWVSIGSPDITDKNGRFSIEVAGTPGSLFLVTTAKNDYVEVWKHHLAIDPIPAGGPLGTYREISVNYNNCPDDICDIGTITAVSDLEDDFQTYALSNTIFKNYVSRAFYVATAAHVSGAYVESPEVYGGVIPNRLVMVKMGADLATPGWYNQLQSRIYLENTAAATIWHEYGHFLQDRIGAFAAIPPYLGPSHNQCTMITNAGAGNQTPNLCWSYLEGLADWFGALNASEFYGGYATMTTKFEFANANPCDTDGAYDVERKQCGTPDTGDADGDGDCSEIVSHTIFPEYRAVESIVANVLWDLLDDSVDPLNYTNIDEVGTATPAEILDVITADMGAHQSCGLLESNSHPMGLDEFWDQWKLLHPDRMADIFAAYAYNLADVGNAADLLAPAPVQLSSQSHEVDVWSRDNSVSLEVIDGVDDVSGSYAYFVLADLLPQTTVGTSGVPTFKSKYFTHTHEVSLPDGASQYIHVNSLDMKGHPSTATAHFGPLLIDTVDPYLIEPFFEVIPIRIDPIVDETDPTLMLGYPADISWGSHDDLSEVAQVRITFDDAFTGFTKDVLTTAAPSGTYRWIVDDVPATSSGLLTITVTDYAGNDVVDSVPAPVKTPFTGPLAVSLGPDTDPCEDGRVISADLQGDGHDDVVLVCRFNTTGHLYVLSGSSNGLIRTQDFPWRPADDLAAGDLDRDGDLDVVTVSWATPGAATEAEILYNDGTGTLVDPGIARPLGALDQKTVRVIHPYNTRLPVIAVFGELQPGNVPAIVAFATSAGYPIVSLPGVDSLRGDWEAADMNSDGYGDLVALGSDASGKEVLSIFSGTATAFSRQDVETYASISKPDLDLGDSNADGKPDIFVMFEDAGLTRVTKLLQRTGASGALFSTAASADTAPRQVASGDGFIIDTANDAMAEVIAMGRTATDDLSGWYLRYDAFIGTLQDTTVAAMVPLAETDTAWGDFDKDGDLDVFQLGSNGTSYTITRYQNLLGDYIDQNDRPKAPTNLSSSYDPVGGYTFSWSPPVTTTSNADETPAAGFGYELRVGTSLNGGEILSWAHPAGASQQGFRLDRFVKLPPGAYWFSVRTVDSGWKRSAPAASKQTIP